MTFFTSNKNIYKTEKMRGVLWIYGALIDGEFFNTYI